MVRHRKEGSVSGRLKTFDNGIAYQYFRAFLLTAILEWWIVCTFHYYLLLHTLVSTGREFLFNSAFWSSSYRPRRPSKLSSIMSSLPVCHVIPVSSKYKVLTTSEESPRCHCTLLLTIKFKKLWRLADCWVIISWFLCHFPRGKGTLMIYQW